MNFNMGKSLTGDVFFYRLLEALHRVKYLSFAFCKLGLICLEGFSPLLQRFFDLCWVGAALGLAPHEARLWVCCLLKGALAYYYDFSQRLLSLRVYVGGRYVSETLIPILNVSDEGGHQLVRLSERQADLHHQSLRELHCDHEAPSQSLSHPILVQV